MNQVENANVELFSNQLTIFLNDLKLSDYEKMINTLIMPRQSKENFKPNDRTINMDYNWPNAVILNTDTVTNLINQIELIIKSKNIVLTYGSPFFVNGLFAKNSNIIVLGDNFKHHEVFPYLQHVYQEILKYGNTVHFSVSKSNYCYKDIENLLI